jgi:hypothetical protein
LVTQNGFQEYARAFMGLGDPVMLAVIAVNSFLKREVAVARAASAGLSLYSTTFLNSVDNSGRRWINYRIIMGCSSGGLH